MWKFLTGLKTRLVCSDRTLNTFKSIIKYVLVYAFICQWSKKYAFICSKKLKGVMDIMIQWSR